MDQLRMRELVIKLTKLEKIVNGKSVNNILE